MKKLIAFLTMMLIPALSLGQTAEISELPARGTLAGSDLYECEIDSTGSYKCTLTEMGAWVLSNPAASANPIISFKDSDATDGDDNGSIDVDCTNILSGQENCDMDFNVQKAGAPTSFLFFDADGVGDAAVTLPDDSIGPDEIKLAGQTDGYFLQYVSAGDTVQWAVGAGGAFNDSSDPIVPYTTTKRFELGDGAGTLAGKVEIGGDANEPQLVVEGHSTQTADIFVIQNDADSELFTVENDGTTTIAGSTSTITGTGNYVEIVDLLSIEGSATPPQTCGSTYYGMLYHDTSGAICICNDANTWEKLFDYTSGDTAGCS